MVSLHYLYASFNTEPFRKKRAVEVNGRHYYPLFNPAQRQAQVKANDFNRDCHETSPLCVAPRTALREKIRAQREQQGSKQNQKIQKNIKRTKKKQPIFRSSVKYIWMGPESCNLVFWFFGSFDFLLFWFFQNLVFVVLLIFLVVLVRFVSPGCEGVALCIQECGPCVTVHSGVGAWECVKHEKAHSHSVPL